MEFFTEPPFEADSVAVGQKSIAKSVRPEIGVVIFRRSSIMKREAAVKRPVLVRDGNGSAFFFLSGDWSYLLIVTAVPFFQHFWGLCALPRSRHRQST